MPQVKSLRGDDSIIPMEPRKQAGDMCYFKKAWQKSLSVTPFSNSLIDLI